MISLLPIALLQCVLAVRGSDSLLRRPQVWPVLQGFCLKVVQVALDRLVIECPSHFIVRRYRLVSQQLPQIREPLNPGQLRGGYIGLELKHLKFDLQHIALADISCFVTRFADIHRVLEAFEILLSQRKSGFGEFYIDELAGNTEGKTALVVGDQRPCLGSQVLSGAAGGAAASCLAQTSS